MATKADSGVKNIEKAAELTAVFLVPFVLAIILFIAGTAEHTSSAPTMSYWIVFFNNISFILLIVFAVLTWLFLASYYLFERSSLLLLKFSIFTSGITILSAIYLGGSYSNFLYTITSEIIFGISLITIIAYWCFCICAFRNINKHPKPQNHLQRYITYEHGGQDVLLGKGDQRLRSTTNKSIKTSKKKYKV